MDVQLISCWVWSVPVYADAPVDAQQYVSRLLQSNNCCDGGWQSSVLFLLLKVGVESNTIEIGLPDGQIYGRVAKRRVIEGL